MATNEYRAFAAGPYANTMSPSAWAALVSLLASGFESGIAKSEQVNTALRQATTGAAGVAEFIKRKGVDALDDGDVSAFAAKLGAAILLHTSGILPTGTVADMYGRAAPDGWLELDGSTRTRSAYPSLWAYAQAQSVVVAESGWASSFTLFSSGDGSTTFRLPDLRGISRRGWDHGRGLDPSRSLGSYQADQMPAHTHTYRQGQTGAGTAGGGDANIGRIWDDSAQTGSAGSGSEVRVKSVALMTCIKY